VGLRPWGWVVGWGHAVMWRVWGGVVCGVGQPVRRGGVRVAAAFLYGCMNKPAVPTASNALRVCYRSEGTANVS